MPGNYERPDLRALPIGTAFRTRKDMSGAFGGTPLKGISYPAGGDSVIVVSSATGHVNYGYRDDWMDSGKTIYRYTGEWHGCGDMQMAGGNQVLVDRSGSIYLFIHDREQYVYSGRFRLLSHRTEQAMRPECKHRHTAIQFDLKKI